MGTFWMADVPHHIIELALGSSLIIKGLTKLGRASRRCLAVLREITDELVDTLIHCKRRWRELKSEMRD